MAGFFGMFRKNQPDNTPTQTTKGSPLTLYTNSSGGDMCGGHHSLEVRAQEDGTAIVSCSDAAWHFEDPKVREYRVDGQILTDLEAVYNKHHMESWHNKTFTKDFVCDGATESFGFGFGHRWTDVHFSSQIFPEPYRSKLKELDDVIAKHLAGASPLPGLVLPERTPEEMVNGRSVPEGEFTFEAYEYCNNTLSFRIGNGTDELLVLSHACLLYRDGEAEPFFTGDSSYLSDVTPHRTEESSVRLDERLAPGNYVLKLSGFDKECRFEIK